MTDIKWIKLDTDVFNNRKIRKIKKMPEGYTIIVIWFELLVVAAESNKDGLIYFTKNIPYTDQLLSEQFDLPLATIQLALQTFVHLEMIEIVDNVICISNWAKYQNVDGMEKVREQTRKRVANYREKQRMLEEAESNQNDSDSNVTSNVTVTASSNSNNTISISSSQNNNEDINNPVLYQLMLNDKSYYEVRKNEVDELRDIYQNADIDYEFKKMIRWIKDNPTKRKTKRGIGKFISNWLDNAQNKYRPNDQQRYGVNGIALSAEEDHLLDDILGVSH